MNIRRVLATAAIPFVIGTFGFAVAEQAIAQVPVLPVQFNCVHLFYKAA